MLSVKPKDNLLPKLFVTRTNDLTDIFVINEENRGEEPKKEESEEEESEENESEENESEENESEEEKKKEEKKKEEKKKEEEEKKEDENSVLLANCDSIFESNYDVNMDHGSYLTKELTNNENVSKETGIKKSILDSVDRFVKNQTTDKIGCAILKPDSAILKSDSVLVVYKNMTLGKEFNSQINKILEKAQRIEKAQINKLYLVLEDCIVDYTPLSNSAEIKVLDLRGNTAFSCCLDGAKTVEKVLLRNNTKENENQLWLYNCGQLGTIYQLSEDTRLFSAARMHLKSCCLDGDFRLVNLNSCCDKLLENWCMSDCTCPHDHLERIKRESFDQDFQPNNENLKGE